MQDEWNTKGFVQLDIRTVAPHSLLALVPTDAAMQVQDGDLLSAWRREIAQVRRVITRSPERIVSESIVSCIAERLKSDFSALIVVCRSKDQRRRHI